MNRRPVAFVVAAVLVGCSGSQPNVAASTRADSAHVAAHAAEPRTGDATGSQTAGSVPIGSTTVAVSGNTTAPAPSTTNENAPAASAPSRSAASASAQSEEAPKRIGARHVLIQWMGSDRAGKSVLRTREQALVLAQEVLKRARAGEDLGRLAVEYSDEPNAGARGGSLGRFGKGQMVGAFEQVAFKLKVGEISDIVETPFGFHIIQRTE
jgi:hypothetical protein